MAEVKLRLNLDAEEVELVVDGKVAISSGQDVFRSWVTAYNEKHKPVPAEPKVVDVSTAEPVTPSPEPAEAVETDVEPPVDNASQE